MKGDIPQAIWCINVAEVHSMKTLVKMKTLFKWLGIVIVVLVMAVGLLSLGARYHDGPLTIFVTVQALWNVGTDFVLVPFAVISYALGDEAGAHEAIAA